MGKIVLAVAMLLAGGLVCADDADDASAKLQEYFALFNAKDTEKVANYIYSTPVHIGGATTHRVLADPGAAIINLNNLYEQIEAIGWVESRIKELRVCIASPTLALIGARYSRLDKEGEAIPPAIRSNLYILQKLDSDWRITAFYAHPGTVKPSCTM